MNEKEWKTTIEELVTSYVRDYQKEKGLPDLWRTPLVGYADANDSYIQKLPEIVTDVHKLPQDFMENPKVVISYFIPFTKALERTIGGVEDNFASKEWADAYKATNTMMASLNEYLVQKIRELGGRAAVTEGIGMLYDVLKSNWSQRHIAYAAGLGTFGINNMLITKEGCCGRYNSIVADIPVESISKKRIACIRARGFVRNVCRIVSRARSQQKGSTVANAMKHVRRIWIYLAWMYAENA